MDQKSISQISSAHQLPSFFKLSTLSVPFGSKCLSSSQLSPTQLSTSFKVFKQLKRLPKESFCWPGCRDGFVRGDVGGTLPLWCVCISDLGASAKTQSLVSLPDCSHQKTGLYFEAMDTELEKGIKPMISSQTALLLIFLQENWSS